MKRIVLLTALCVAFVMALAACSQDQDREAALDLSAASWEEIVDQARGTTVGFYMYGGFAHANRWVDTYVADQLKIRYGITLNRVPMDAGVFVNKLLTEKSAGRETGTIDLLWVNGENFKVLKQADALFGPIVHALPNFDSYVNPEPASLDFGFPVEGYEAPYGQAQFVFEYDRAVTRPPASFAELSRWVRANPGRFTYPQPPDFTGSAFIRQAFYAVTGGPEQYAGGFDPVLFDEKAPLLWAYLNDLEPFLWQEGRTYPKDQGTLDTLFSRGEVALNMSYHPLHAQSRIADKAYPDTVRTVVMAEGSLFNLHFTAVPFNAPNKAGALVLADFLLSPEAQLSKLMPTQWGDFPAIDLNRLDKNTRVAFKAVDLGPATLSAEELAAAAVPEIPAEYLEALERGWEENVLRK